MKNHLVKLEYIEFPLIFLLFVLPPLRSNTLGATITLFVPVLFLCYYTLIGAYFYVRSPRLHSLPFKKVIISSVTCFVLIMLGMFSLSALAEYVGYNDKIAQGFTDALTTEKLNSLRLIHLFVSTLVLACFEELLFRYYLPERGAQFLSLFIKKNYRVCCIVSELFALFCFAFAHRYLGFFAVLNAFFAGSLFRLTVKKTGTIISTCIVHTFYNFILLLFYYYS